MPYKDKKMEYRKRKRKLINMLGGKCEDCGTKVGLQFHHCQPRTWVAKNVESIQRMRVYAREAAQGLLVLLCGWCNKTEGIPD